MTREIIDLRTSILEGRYEDALAICDELEWMSKKGIIITIKSFVFRLLIHLIKNQVEQRLTNSWASSISDSIRKIQRFNLKENKNSYYINTDEWKGILEEEFDAAIDEASVEIFQGQYSPFQLLEMVEKDQVIEIAKELLELSYKHSVQTLPAIMKQKLTELPGGENWKLGKR